MMRADLTVDLTLDDIKKELIKEAEGKVGISVEKRIINICPSLHFHVYLNDEYVVRTH